MFEAPNFTFWNVGYTAIGAMLFWAKFGQRQLRPYVLAKLLDGLGYHGNSRIVVEFLIFIAFGCIIGVGIAHPINVPQAIGAGMGWTGLVAHLPKPRRV